MRTPIRLAGALFAALLLGGMALAGSELATAAGGPQVPAAAPEPSGPAALAERVAAPATTPACRMPPFPTRFFGAPDAAPARPCKSRSGGFN